MSEPTPEYVEAFEAWLADGHEAIAPLARKYPPWHTYFVPETGQHAIIVSYAEDGTIRARVWRPDFGLNIEAQAMLGMYREVFGMDPTNWTVVATPTPEG